MGRIYGLSASDDPFTLLGIGPDGTLRTARETLAQRCGFFCPFVNPEDYPAEKMEIYRKTLHAYMLLRDGTRWEQAAALMEIRGKISGLIELRPYSDIEEGELDFDWVAFYLTDVLGEAQAEREDCGILGYELVANVARHLVDLPDFIHGWRVTEIAQLQTTEILEQVRILPEVSERSLPQDPASWGITWQTTVMTKDGDIAGFEVKKATPRTRALYAGPGKAPLWDVTLCMPYWLGCTDEERRALIHEVLMSCACRQGKDDADGQPTYKVGVYKPTLRVNGYTVARFGPRTVREAQQVAVAAAHPRTRALLEEAEAMGLGNKYDVRASQEAQGSFHLEELSPRGSEALEAFEFDAAPFGEIHA